MTTRIEIVAFAGSFGLFMLTVELVRRRRLQEQYSLLWLLTSVVLIGLSIWRSAIEGIASLLGILYAPAALLLVGIGFVLVILLHYSLVISKLTTENNELAQRYALLSHRLQDIEARLDQELPEDRASRLAGSPRSRMERIVLRPSSSSLPGSKAKYGGTRSSSLP